MTKDKVITAIDVGSSKVAVVIAVVDKEGAAAVVGTATGDSRGVRKGQVVDIEQTVASITSVVDAAERMAGLTVGSAFVSVGGVNIQSQNSKGVVAVSQPEGEIKPEDIRRVVEAAKAVSIPSSREILHVLPRGYIVDGQEGIKDPSGMTGVRLEVETQIITGATTSIRNLAKCVAEVGVDVDSLVFSGLSSAAAVLSETEKELGVVLIDIGAGTTDVSIYVDGALAHCGVIPVGARNVTNDLAVGLRVSLESAEKIKLMLGQKPKFAIEDEKKSKTDNDEIDISTLGISEDLRKVSRKTLIEGIIKPRLTEIFTFVGMEIQKSGFAGMTPSGVVVTGGGSETVGILEACRSRLVMPCRIGAPMLGADYGLTGLIDEMSTPVYSTVVGIIIYGKNFSGRPKESGLRSRPGFANMAQNLPFKNLLPKVTNFLKSFLP